MKAVWRRLATTAGWPLPLALLLLALAVWQSGQPAAFSCSEATEHLHSNMAVIAQFLPLRMSIETASAPVVRIAPL